MDYDYPIKYRSNMYLELRNRYFTRALHRVSYLMQETAWNIASYILAGFTLGYFGSHLVVYLVK